MTDRTKSLRAAVLAYIDSQPTYLTAFDIAQATNLPYKAVIDALQALHNKGQIARFGKKSGAKWASLRLKAKDDELYPWRLLAAAWYGGQFAL